MLDSLRIARWRRDGRVVEVDGRDEEIVTAVAVTAAVGGAGVGAAAFAITVTALQAMCRGNSVTTRFTSTACRFSLVFLFGGGRQADQAKSL